MSVIQKFVQQAIAQVLTPIYEKQFHEHSYGFRPNRCAQQAIVTALEMMNDGYDWIVDIDLEKFFDTVNHDKLMTLIGNTIVFECKMFTLFYTLMDVYRRKGRLYTMRKAGAVRFGSTWI